MSQRGRVIAPALEKEERNKIKAGGIPGKKKGRRGWLKSRVYRGGLTFSGLVRVHLKG